MQLWVPASFFFNADCLFKLAKAYLLGLFFSILFLSGLYPKKS